MPQTASIQTITPKRAAELLENTTFQRPIRTAHINFLIQQLRDGLWKVNGETIVLNGSKVIDGQHRLWAVLDSGISIETWVVEGVPDKAFDTIDTGIARASGDTAAVAFGRDTLRVPHWRALAAAAKTIMGFDETGRWNSHISKNMPNATMVEWMRQAPDLIDDLKAITTVGRAPVALSLLLAVYWLGKPKYPAAFDDFVRPLLTGVGLHAGDPVLVLREKAAARAVDFRSQRDQLAVLIRAWNAWAVDEKVKYLRFSGSDAFPTMRLSPDQSSRSITERRKRA